jgi:hypothetical protein
MLNNWEKREATNKRDPIWPRINLARDRKLDFWSLFQLEMTSWITGQPLEDVIPLLRCLIDKQWEDDPSFDGPLPDGVGYSVISLLYYAWDRSREVVELRGRLREAHMRLLALTGGQA